MGARLVAVEPVPDTGHYFSQFRLPPVNVYAGGRSHHTIFIGPHNPWSSSGGCSTLGIDTRKDHEVR